MSALPVAEGPGEGAPSTPSTAHRRSACLSGVSPMTDPLIKSIAAEAWGVDLGDPTLMASDREFLLGSAREIVRMVRRSMQGESNE